MANDGWKFRLDFEENIHMTISFQAFKPITLDLFKSENQKRIIDKHVK